MAGTIGRLRYCQNHAWYALPLADTKKQSAKQVCSEYKRQPLPAYLAANRAQRIPKRTEDETRALTRQTIAQSAGDAVTFLLVETAKLAKAINSATTIAQIRVAAETLATALTPLADAVEAGTVTPAYQRNTGGQAAQLAEIATRIGQVGSAFQDESGSDEQPGE